MEWPIYCKEKLIIGNLNSNAGVATLWMPKENVADVLDKASYSVCGQLYTKRGLNYMFRNILANPLIRYLVLCGVDRQGSGDALRKFFELGVKKEAGEGDDIKGWRIINDTEALLDSRFSLGALRLLRENVELIDMRMRPLSEVSARVKTLKSKEAFGEPVLFEEPKEEIVSRFPTDTSVFKIRRDYIGDAWLDVLKTVMKFGVNTPGLYGDVKEVHNLAVVIEKEDPDEPKIDEFLKFRQDGLDLYMKGFFEVDPGNESYTYGERIFNWEGLNQERIIVEKLSKYRHDRGALAVLWQPAKDNFPPKDVDVNVLGQTGKWRVPCLVMILGQCLDEGFNMTAVFRNNDMYGAWPLNAFALRKFQKNISQKIGKNMGALTIISHIAEIYQGDWNDSSAIVNEYDNLTRTCIYDPRGYYTVSVEGADIVLTFYTPDGAEQIAQFRKNGNDPKVARDLCAKVLKEMLLSELGAVADLGRQLAKAETAVKLGLKFEQDKPLSR